MKLSIAIDAFRMIAEPLTSGAIYASELTKSLSELPEVQKLFLLLPRKPGCNFIHEKIIKLEKVKTVYPQQEFFPERKLNHELHWIQWEIRRLLRRLAEPIDYYVAPYHHPPILLPRNIKVVTIIHDLCGLRSDCGYSKMKKGFYHHILRFLIASSRSDLFIPISEYTKNQLENSLVFSRTRCSKVVYNGVFCKSISSTTTNKILPQFGLSRESYFLGFAALGPRKGFDLLLAAYQLFRKTGEWASLVLIVPTNDQSAIKQQVYNLGLKDVIFVSGINQTDRDALYQGALALLFPSRCEGFGYPILEAMRQGCPPIAYKRSPASEIVSSISPLLSSLNPEEIADHMLALKSLDSNSRFLMSKRLIQRSLLFTGDRFGHQFLEAMMEIQ